MDSNKCFWEVFLRNRFLDVRFRSRKPQVIPALARSLSFDTETTERLSPMLSRPDSRTASPVARQKSRLTEAADKEGGEEPADLLLEETVRWELIQGTRRRPED